MELENCHDPALVLHLAVLAIFTIVTQNILHASGRQVPSIILFLKGQLKDEDFIKIQQYHGNGYSMLFTYFFLHKKV